MEARTLAGDGPRRARTLTLAWRPCARGLPLPTLAGAAALAATPTAVVLARGDHDVAGALVCAALIAGAVGAFAVDDPAEETLAASPTGLARRRLLRLSAITLGVAALAAVLVAAAVAAGITVGAGGLGRRAAELVATSGLAVAAAGAAHRRGVVAPAHGGAVIGVLGVLLVSALEFRFHSLPALLDSPHHERWWLIGLVAWSAAAWTWRDPARSSLTARTRQSR